MRRLAVAGIACAVVALSFVPAAEAKQKSPFANGNRSAHLLGEWWATALEIPFPENPLPGNGDPCIRLGHVLAPAFVPDGEISCSVGKNTPILAITFTSECSDAEEPPFFGATKRERRACAIEADDGITVNQVGIDGKVYDVDRYRVQSNDRKVRLPEDDLFGVDASTLRFTADGWAPLIEPLPPGHHEITIHVVGEFAGSDGPVDVIGTLQLDVARR